MARAKSKSLSTEQIDALYDALDANMTQRAIAKLVGCSVSTVNDHKKRRERHDYDAEGDAENSRVLDWNSLEDRCEAAWRLCRLEPDPQIRREILQAAIWPNPANYASEDEVYNANRELVDQIANQVEAEGGDSHEGSLFDDER